MADRWYTLQFTGHPTAIPDAEYRNKAWEYRETTGEDQRIHVTKFDIRALIAEAEEGDTTTPTHPAHEQSSGPRSPAPYNPNVAQESIEYDPTKPLLFLPSLMERIRAKTANRSLRNSTEVYEHNPHLLMHILAGAPYTASFCKRCTRTRSCRVHREVFQSETSVSLCAHMRMNLYWAVNDPDNSKSSWKLIIKDYTVWDPELIPEHRGCKVYKPSERVPLLVDRLVEDQKRERLRSNNKRRAADEIYALLGAWERAKLEILERQKRKRAMEEEKQRNERKAQERLAETLRMVQDMQKKDQEEQENQKRKYSEIEEGEIVDVRKKVRIEEEINETVQQEDIALTPPFTSTHTPEPTTAHVPKMPGSASPRPECPPKNAPTPPPLSPRTRSRSSSLAPTPLILTPSSAKKSKKVRFIPEIESSPVIVRPRMHSPPAQATYQDVLSPIASHYYSYYGMEDEVDYNDGEISE